MLEIYTKMETVLPKTINELKRKAINAWLNKRGKYLSTISRINSMSKNNAYELQNYLVREELKQNLIDRIVRLDKHFEFPYLISVEYGLLLVIERNRELPIHWSEVIKFCRMSFKEHGHV